MNPCETLPMLCECELDANAHALLAIAERIIREECCDNGCAHRGVSKGWLPSHCPCFAPSGPLLDCSRYVCDDGGVKVVS